MLTVSAFSFTDTHSPDQSPSRSARLVFLRRTRTRGETWAPSLLERVHRPPPPFSFFFYLLFEAEEPFRARFHSSNREGLCYCHGLLFRLLYDSLVQFSLLDVDIHTYVWETLTRMEYDYYRCLL